MMPMLMAGARNTIFDRQTGEGGMSKLSKEQSERQWREAWTDGETEAGRETGQEVSGQPTEDRSGIAGRQGATQETEEGLT